MFKVLTGCACALMLGAGCAKPESAANASTAQTRPAAPDALCLAQPSPDAAGDRALRELQAGLRAAPDDARQWVAAGEAWVRKARAQAQPGLYRNADACAQAALARSPRHGAALAMHGLALQNEHRFDEARALAREILARDADDPMAWGLLSDAELELGELSQAIDAAQRMVDLKPGLPAYGRAAHLRWLQGDAAGAKRLYEQAIRAGAAGADREPGAFMIVQAALLFWHEGDYQGAGAGFDLALRQVADYPPALDGKGRVALARGEYHAAARWFERALARQGLVESAWLLGDALALAGDRAAAERAYTRVIRDGRRHDPRTLALFYATKRREPEEAVRLAREEFARRKDAYTKDALAFALYRRGQIDEARRLSAQVIASGTLDARLLFHAGAIASAAGDTTRGRELTARALRLNPRFDPLLTEQSDVTAEQKL